MRSSHAAKEETNLVLLLKWHVQTGQYDIESGGWSRLWHFISFREYQQRALPFERNSFASYLFPRLELLAVEAVEEEGEEEVEHHEVTHDEGGQEYGEAGLGHPLN